MSREIRYPLLRRLRRPQDHASDFRGLHIQGRHIYAAWEAIAAHQSEAPDWQCFGTVLSIRNLCGHESANRTILPWTRDTWATQATGWNQHHFTTSSWSGPSRTTWVHCDFAVNVSFSGGVLVWTSLARTYLNPFPPETDDLSFLSTPARHRRTHFQTAQSTRPT